MKKWEYGDVTVPKDAQWQTVELLDAAGAEGWETTGIVDETHHVKIYLMKRPVEGTVDAPEVEIKHDHSVTRKCGAFCDLRGTKHEITKASY
jgi:hypothetical protein